MHEQNQDQVFHLLNDTANEQKREEALRHRCNQYREDLKKRDLKEIAGFAAMSLQKAKDGSISLSGSHFLETFIITWPELRVIDSAGNQAKLVKEALWLHYLDRADGSPLTRRWVNLSEIGGLFYQQAFQGYCGDELAQAWGDDLGGLRQKCLSTGGWELSGPGDLNIEWRALPRLPLFLCYRLPVGSKAAWATMLFDAAANHYVAADVAAVTAKELADQIKP